MISCAGMGKTIQAIALILANKPDSSNRLQQKLRLQSEEDHNKLMSNVPMASYIEISNTEKQTELIFKFCAGGETG